MPEELDEEHLYTPLFPEDQHTIIKPDPAATVDIEIRIGEDWVSKLPTGY